MYTASQALVSPEASTLFSDNGGFYGRTTEGSESLSTPTSMAIWGLADLDIKVVIPIGATGILVLVIAFAFLLWKRRQQQQPTAKKHLSLDKEPGVVIGDESGITVD